MDLKEIVARINKLDYELAMLKRDVLKYMRATTVQPAADPTQLELDL